jgi:hypothetical protein
MLDPLTRRVVTFYSLRNQHLGHEPEVPISDPAPMHHDQLVDLASLMQQVDGLCPRISVARAVDRSSTLWSRYRELTSHEAIAAEQQELGRSLVRVDGALGVILRALHAMDVSAPPTPDQIPGFADLAPHWVKAWRSGIMTRRETLLKGLGEIASQLESTLPGGYGAFTWGFAMTVGAVAEAGTWEGREVREVWVLAGQHAIAGWTRRGSDRDPDTRERTPPIYVNAGQLAAEAAKAARTWPDVEWDESLRRWAQALAARCAGDPGKLTDLIESAIRCDVLDHEVGHQDVPEPALQEILASRDQQVGATEFASSEYMAEELHAERRPARRAQKRRESVETEAQLFFRAGQFAQIDRRENDIERSVRRQASGQLTVRLLALRARLDPEPLAILGEDTLAVLQIGREATSFEGFWEDIAELVGRRSEETARMLAAAAKRYAAS